MKESQDSQLKAEDGLREKCLENLALSKELAKSLEEIYFTAQDTFETALKQVGYFYPTRLISRVQVRLDQTH